MIVMIQNHPVEIKGYEIDQILTDSEVVELTHAIVEEISKHAKDSSSPEEAFERINSVSHDDTLFLLSSSILPDPVEIEALRLATDLIRDKLKAQNLPIDTDLSVHASRLLEARPGLRTSAYNILRARARTRADMMKELKIGGSLSP